jgi:hypothetical protein
MTVLVPVNRESNLRNLMDFLESGGGERLYRYVETRQASVPAGKFARREHRPR